VRERFFDGLGGGLARNLACALAADAVKYGKQPSLDDGQKAILIDRSARIKPAVADSAYLKLHRHPSQVTLAQSAVASFSKCNQSLHLRSTSFDYSSIIARTERNNDKERDA
jgi:hypothetical protein